MARLVGGVRLEKEIDGGTDREDLRGGCGGGNGGS